MESIDKIIAKRKHCREVTPEENQAIIEYAQKVVELVGLAQAIIMNDIVVFFPNEIAQAMRNVAENDTH